MTEYAEESWEQLRGTFEELKENLEPEEELSKLTGPRESSNAEDEDEDWTSDEEEWIDTDDEWPAPEIHPPRVGPKR